MLATERENLNQSATSSPQIIISWNFPMEDPPKKEGFVGRNCLWQNKLELMGNWVGLTKVLNRLMQPRNPRKDEVRNGLTTIMPKICKWGKKLITNRWGKDNSFWEKSLKAPTIIPKIDLVPRAKDPTHVGLGQIEMRSNGRPYGGFSIQRKVFIPLNESSPIKLSPSVIRIEEAPTELEGSRFVNGYHISKA